MGELDENKFKVNCFWLFTTIETNFISSMNVICSSKVLLWEDGRMAGRAGAGGIGTKTNSAPNSSWVGVGAELGKNGNTSPS